MIKSMKTMLRNAKEESKMKSQGEGKKEVVKNQRYKNTLVKPGVQKQWVQKGKQELESKTLGSLNRDSKNTTLFVHNLPENLNTLAIWNFMRKWGRILDCIMPVRKDKLGKRYGFINLQTIGEAENFIKGINRKMLVGNVIRAQFANKQIKKDHQMEKKKVKLEDASLGVRRENMSLLLVNLERLKRKKKVMFAWIPQTVCLLRILLGVL